MRLARRGENRAMVQTASSRSKQSKETEETEEEGSVKKTQQSFPEPEGGGGVYTVKLHQVFNMANKCQHTCIHHWEVSNPGAKAASYRRSENKTRSRGNGQDSAYSRLVAGRTELDRRRNAFSFLRKVSSDLNLHHCEAIFKYSVE